MLLNAPVKLLMTSAATPTTSNPNMPIPNAIQIIVTNRIRLLLNLDQTMLHLGLFDPSLPLLQHFCPCPLKKKPSYMISLSLSWHLSLMVWNTRYIWAMPSFAAHFSKEGINKNLMIGDTGCDGHIQQLLLVLKLTSNPCCHNLECKWFLQPDCKASWWNLHLILFQVSD